MAISIRLSLRDGVTATCLDDRVVVEGHGIRLSFGPRDPAVAAAVLGMIPPGCTEDNVSEALLDAGEAGSLATWYHIVERLERRGWLCRSLLSDERALVSLVPVSTAPASTGHPDPISSDRPHRLSRFAYLRREGATMVLESPTAHARVILHDPAASALVASLAFSSKEIDPARCFPGLPAEAAPLVLGLLHQAGMIEPAEVDDDGSMAAGCPEPLSLGAWEFHDLLFHARSRRGRTDAPFGGTYRLAGKMEPPPPVRPTPPGIAQALPRPDLARLEAEDPPLSRMVEARRSIRVYGSPPIDARQLGEWLFRVARIRGEHAVDLDTPAAPVRLATADRPYPSGGALYELEFYAAIASCRGVPAGLHYYEPRGHALIHLRGPTPEVEGLWRDAADSAGIPRDSLQVLVIVTARLPRISWKYASIGYALVLKHVGVVFHAMYLAATAMGLAPCALGAGDSDLFARAAGIDYYTETSVGEFLLGSRQADGRADSGDPVSPAGLL